MSKSYSANIQSMNEDNKFYEKHKEEILDSGHNFAVIWMNQIKYFDSEKEVYKEYPSLNPKNISYGNKPKIIDIQSAKDPLIFELKKIRSKKEKLEKILSQTVNNLHDLDQKELEIIEKRKSN